MTGAEFKAARERLGLTYSELGAILGGIRPDTIRRKWEIDQPGPSPMACQIVGWMLEGYRPPEWPDRLTTNDDMACAACTIALLVVEKKTGLSRWDVNSGRALDIIRAKAGLVNRSGGGS